jgi:hypothetical protein
MSPKPEKASNGLEVEVETIKDLDLPDDIPSAVRGGVSGGVTRPGSVGT